LKNSARVALGAIAVFAAIQLVPVTRDNPPVEEEITAPPPVLEILRNACYDCHSHETVWPWYSHVAPISWLLAHDVHEARKHMDFSAWNRYDAEDRADHMEDIQEAVDEGEMPPWFYVPMHPKARLGPEQVETLRAWTGKAR